MSAVEALKKEYGEYAQHIKVLTHKKNVGTKQKPEYITQQNLYMTVTGRLRIMVDEHKARGERFTIEPAQFQVGPDGNTLLASVTLKTCRGTATGHARVNLNGTGVDATNPYENAETSAIGRALGFLGYGLIGDGVASFEEVVDALSSENQHKSTLPEPPKQSQGNNNKSKSSNPETVPAQKQKKERSEKVKAVDLIKIKKKLEEKVGKEETIKIMPKIKTKDDLDTVCKKYGIEL